MYAMLRCVCLCLCVEGNGGLCAIYNFYFFDVHPHHCEMLESLEGHLQMCPTSIPLVEQSIFFGVCVTFAGCHIPGIAPSPPPGGWRGGAGPEPWGGASGSFRALCQPLDNCQQRGRGG